MKKFIAVLALLAACKSGAPKTETQAAATPAPMESADCVIESEDTARGSWKCEVAKTNDQRLVGLMNRKEVPAGTAMLFVFDTPDTWSMWMKNTLVPLDMIFMNSDGVVTAVALNRTPLSEEYIEPCGIQYEVVSHDSDADADVDEFFDACEAEHAKPEKLTKYVLEVPAGEAEAANIQVGDKLSTENLF
ncbi:MAG: DUF192 domain-containing protein [Rickettsiales bacterium]|jgi:uncharacterized membrane protein (UPF0127 family)|nr:DUF192 domain-containing protein [Rickettsiales bacterium]